MLVFKTSLADFITSASKQAKLYKLRKQVTAATGRDICKTSPKVQTQSLDSNLGQVSVVHWYHWNVCTHKKFSKIEHGVE